MTAPLTCNELQTRLSRFLDSRLTPAEQEQVGAHLEGCAPCQAEREALDRTDALVAAALSDHPFGDQAVEAIIGRLERERSQPSRHRQPRRPAGMWLAVAAAALLVALGLQLTREAPEEITAEVAQAAAPVELELANGMLLAPDGSTRTLDTADAVALRPDDRLLAIQTPTRLELPDGTRLDLHADTEIQLQTSRDGGLNVVLGGAEGKVFCDVSKRKSDTPFRVKARGLDVAVLGARFIVEQRPRSSSVIVIEGQVMASASNERRSLGPRDQAEVFFTPALAGRLVLSQVSPRRFGLWVPLLADEYRELNAAQARPTDVERPPPARPTGQPDPAPTPSQLDLPVEPPVRVPPKSGD